MAIVLGHLLVPSRDKNVGARFLAQLLDVPCQLADGMFAPVYVNESLTIDFCDWDEFEVHHYCFHVSDQEFEAILGRIQDARVEYRSSPHGPMYMQVSTENGGKNLYWFDPDGHNWEILTVSYARPAVPSR